MNIGEIIRQYCFDHNMSFRSFAEKAGVTSGYISMLTLGKNSSGRKPITPSIETYKKLAAAMGMSIDELFQKLDNPPINIPSRDLVFFKMDDLQHHKIPLVGSVAGGQPIYDEEVDMMIEGPTKASCAVRLVGQSMEPTYMDGDIIYIREQPNVNDGQVAVVILDDEACLKRVYHIQNGLQLLSDNPKYKPITATFDEYNTIRILGIPCGFTRMFEN